MQDFYKSLDYKKYKNLIEVELSSTYICKQTFLIMNINKNIQRLWFTDNHLEDILKTVTSSISPEYDKLVDGKRSNMSH